MVYSFFEEIFNYYSCHITRNEILTEIQIQIKEKLFQTEKWTETIGNKFIIEEIENYSTGVMTIDTKSVFDLIKIIILIVSTNFFITI